MNKLKLLVVFGGKSSEHSVSLVSAAGVIENLDTDIYEIIKVGITKDGQWLLTDENTDKIRNGSWELNKNNISVALSLNPNEKGLVLLYKDCYTSLPIDVSFPVLHGANGEDGTIQGLFEIADIPYVGPGVSASANSMDKAITKIIIDNANMKQAKWILIYSYDFNDKKEETIHKIENTFTYPVFIKPSSTGSSVGISKAKNKTELENAIIEASKYNDKILIEEFINGQEIEVAVLGNKNPIASVCGEITPARDFYDFEAKYNDNNSLLFIPARIDEKTALAIKEQAVKAYTSLDCVGLSRVDFFVTKDTNEIIFNEINTIPGFTSISMYPKLFEASGIAYKELLNRLINLALEPKKGVFGIG
jgi:D-alanine-D-alanine ligase